MNYRIRILGSIFLMLGAFTVVNALPAASGPTVKEDFVNAMSPNYEIWGAADPFNRVDAFKGVLELEGSEGYEGFGIYFKQQFDLSKGPVTVSFDMIRNGKTDGSEICVWFVNQYLIKGSPWDEGDFVRAQFNSTDNKVALQETSPQQRGMGTLLTEKPGVFTMGKKFHVDFIMDTTTVTVKIDGVETVKSEHHLKVPTGYVHLHDWHSLTGEIDYISNFSINL